MQISHEILKPHLAVVHFLSLETIRLAARHAVGDGSWLQCLESYRTPNSLNLQLAIAIVIVELR